MNKIYQVLVTVPDRIGSYEICLGYFSSKMIANKHIREHKGYYSHAVHYRTLEIKVTE